MAERPEDLNLPNSVVGRIIKEALPDNVNVSRDARLAISKAASVFVLYATSCANAFAVAGKRKTITGQDVLLAMEEMEFEQFVEPLKKALDAYKNEQKSRKSAAATAKKAKDDEPAVAAGDKEEESVAAGDKEEEAVAAGDKEEEVVIDVDMDEAGEDTEQQQAEEEVPVVEAT